MTPEAAALIETANDANLGPIPGYGSDEWNALAQYDPRRAAAFALAAEAWRAESSPERIAERARAEIRVARRAWLRDIADAFLAGQESVRDASLQVGATLDMAQVVSEIGDVDRARRHRLAMLQSRPNDFLGRDTA